MDLFFDLEETLIPSILECDSLINVPALRGIIHSYGASEIGLFSYALHDYSDLSEFKDRGGILRIQKALGVRISCIPLVQAIQATYENRHGVKFATPTQFIRSVNKKNSFEAWVLATRPSRDALLVDDLVESLTICYETQKIQFVNICDL